MQNTGGHLIGTNLIHRRTNQTAVNASAGDDGGDDGHDGAHPVLSTIDKSRLNKAA